MASVATLSNSYRLGGNEAPPAVMSVFSGSTLYGVFQAIMNMRDVKESVESRQESIKIVNSIPEIFPDNTDRNRTSPFAFTGNRFEFRAAGSSANCAASMIVINAAMAHQLNEFKAQIDALVAEGMEQEEALYKVLKETIVASKNIRFEGDGYSDEWKQEAAQRGLTNISHVPMAIMKFSDDKAKEVLIGEKIFNESELNCRVEVELEKYTKKVQIESRVLGDMAINHIVPTAVIYQNRLLENLRGLRETFSAEEYEFLGADRRELVKEIQHRILDIKRLVREMTEARKISNHLGSQVEKAFSYEERVSPYLHAIREHIDHLELEIDDEIWPLPKYRELLFTK
jgi:glutamine synthetase